MSKYLSVEEIVDILNNYDHHCCEDAVCKVTVDAKNGILCPHCGESYYMALHSSCTAAYYPPIYKDGVNINPDRNTTTTECKCMNCGKYFSYQS